MASDDSSATAALDPRVVAAMREYAALVDAGERPDRRAFLSRHADVADALRECIGGLSFVQSAARRLRDESGAAGPAIDPATAEPLGDFRLIRQIGRGGMGLVYEAEQISLGRRVALKVLPTAAALDARLLHRFRNEALAAAALHHTNVVPVHAVGCERGVHFYAMQLIDGQSLADVIKDLREQRGALESPSTSLATLRTDGRIEFHRAVALLGAQAADGLEYAHRCGVIHRDVKPGNLLLDRDGRLWIADFGLAILQAGDREDALTRTGDVVGTLRYMSPEQAGRRATLLDQRTDVYSLGVTLYELLTLRPAVSERGDRWALLAEVEHAEPPSARAADATVPAELDVIIGRAMAKDPADRYESAGELAADLRRYLADEPIKARPPTLRDRAGRWARRHRRALLVASAILAVVSAASLVTTALVGRANVKVTAALAAERDRAAEAERSYGQARAAIDLLARVATEEFANVPEADDERRLLLETALGYYEQYLNEHAAAEREGDADAADLAAARRRVTAILDELDETGRLRRTGELAELLRLRDVRNDLGLAGSPRDITDRLRDAFRFDRRDLVGLTATQRRERIEAVEQAGRRAIEAELTAGQFERLLQIRRQVQGARALLDAGDADRLGLSPEQRRAAREIVDAFHDGWERLGPVPKERPDLPSQRGGPPPPRREAERALLAESRANALALLTPEQREIWRTLCGEPFEGSDLPPNLGTGFGPIFGDETRRPDSPPPPPPLRPLP